MSKYVQSGIECFSLPEVYFVGASEEGADMLSLKRYDRKPLRYKVGGRWRKWTPSFIVRTLQRNEFIVDVTPAYSGRGSRLAGRTRTDDPEEAARNQAHPDVLLVDGERMKRLYYAMIHSARINEYEEVS